MCRKAVKGKKPRPADNPAGDWCTELHERWSEEWDTKCPLRPPEPFKLQEKVDKFIETIQSYCNRMVEKEDVIKAAQHDDLREWYIKHGQKSGYHRQKIYDRYSVPVSAFQDKNKKKPTAKLEKEVLERDHYHCRYCGCKLIDHDVLKKLVQIANNNDLKLFKQRYQEDEEEKRVAGNDDVAGLFFSVCPVSDHVIPYSLHGSTTKENLVSSCYICNYGKQNYTCYQIGIEDPFRRPPVEEKWNGLSDLIPILKNIETMQKKGAEIVELKL